MIRVLLLACLLAASTGYARIPLGELAGREERWGNGARLMVSGIWRPDAPFERLVRGVLEDGPRRVRVLGSAFDWMPPPGRRVDFWGAIRMDGGRPYLEFHNGRLHGDTTRRPRPAPRLEDGRQFELVVRLRQIGSEPFVHWVAETEDRVVITLDNRPPGPIPSGTIVRAVILVRATGPLGISAQLISATPVPGALPPAPGG